MTKYAAVSAYTRIDGGSLAQFLTQFAGLRECTIGYGPRKRNGAARYGPSAEHARGLLRPSSAPLIGSLAWRSATVEPFISMRQYAIRFPGFDCLSAQLFSAVSTGRWGVCVCSLN